MLLESLDLNFVFDTCSLVFPDVVLTDFVIHRCVRITGGCYLEPINYFLLVLLFIHFTPPKTPVIGNIGNAIIEMTTEACRIDDQDTSVMTAET